MVGIEELVERQKEKENLIGKRITDYTKQIMEELEKDPMRDVWELLSSYSNFKLGIQRLDAQEILMHIYNKDTDNGTTQIEKAGEVEISCNGRKDSCLHVTPETMINLEPFCSDYWEIGLDIDELDY